MVTDTFQLMPDYMVIWKGKLKIKITFQVKKIRWTHVRGFKYYYPVSLNSSVMSCRFV